MMVMVANGRLRATHRSRLKPSTVKARACSHVLDALRAAISVALVEEVSGQGVGFETCRHPGVDSICSLKEL